MSVDLQKGAEIVLRPDVEIVELPQPQAARQTVIGTLVQRPRYIITTVARHQAVRAVARTCARAVGTTLAGYQSWGRRGWSAATFGAYRRAVVTAEQIGDREALQKALELLIKAKDTRSKRLRELPELVFGLLRMAAGTAVGAVALLVVAGLAVQLTPGGWNWTDWWGAVFAVLATLGDLLFFTIAASLWAATPVLLLAGWREGRRVAGLPRWLRTTADADLDIEIDERTVTRALDALRIPIIRDYLKAGGQLQYIQACRQDGRGTSCRIRLPIGVSAAEIAKPARREKLATGLYRATKETWPTVGNEAGILDLWVADKGALAEGAGPYPLLDEGFTDWFKGFPFGRTLRGDPIVIPMAGRNTLIGGMPDQGKSSAARVNMIGAALELTCELRIWVPDTNFDFECFRPRCSRYVMGAEDEHFEAILEDLRELYREMQLRGQLLVQYEIPEVTREYASKGIGLHPIAALLEEAHILLQHPIYGEEASKLVTEIVRLGRKRAIHLQISTQAPTGKSIPRDVTRNCSNGIAFAVGDHVANDALLGQGAYAGGHRATELIPGADKGCAVVKGFSGQRSEIVQAYFLSVARESDQVTPIIDRALDALARTGKSVPGFGPRQSTDDRDLLEDLAAALGEVPVPIADVPALLSAYAPGWAPYRSLTGKRLREFLKNRYGIRVPSTGNRWPLDPVSVRQELAHRGTADLDALEGPRGA